MYDAHMSDDGCGGNDGLRVVLIALPLASPTAMAQKPDLSNANVVRSLNELSGEMLECAVFFAMVVSA